MYILKRRTSLYAAIYFHNLFVFTKSGAIKIYLLWLGCLRIYVTLTIFQSYRDLAAEDIQFLKSKWQDPGSNPGPLTEVTLQTKSLTIPPPPFPKKVSNIRQCIVSIPVWGSWMEWGDWVPPDSCSSDPVVSSQWSYGTLGPENKKNMWKDEWHFQPMMLDTWPKEPKPKN